MIIACDVDGVLADLDTEWLRRYNLESGDNLTPDRLTKWELDELVRPGWKKRLYELLHDPHIYEDVRPYPGASETVDKLKEMGRVIFLTSCPTEHLSSKFLWLQRWGFLGTSRNATFDYFPIRDKHLVNADVLLDDRIKNVEEFPRESFLVQRPHNKTLKCSRPRLPGVGIDSAPEVIKSLISLSQK